MVKKSVKQQREAAIKAEVDRRIRRRATASPVSHKQMLDLLEFVGRQIIEGDVDRGFRQTKLWAQKSSVDFEALRTFLVAERINDDWDVIFNGDPYALFGATETRLTWMPIGQSDLEALLDWLDEQLPDMGCRHDFRLTRQWLSTKSTDVSVTLAALLAQGGGCDCEVLMNVEPEYIYPNRSYGPN